MADKSVRRKDGEAKLPARNVLVSEFASEYQGAPPPFGDLRPLPMPLDRISYRHPSEEDRPALVPHRD